MSTGSFASLTSGLLARKGEARPSAEQNVAAVLRTPTYKQPVLMPPVEAGDIEEEAVLDSVEPVSNPVAEMKVKIDDAFAMWPAKKPARTTPALEDEMWKLDQPLSLPPSSRHSERTSVRFTHAQARALRLAALLLDRPQQDLIEAGIEGKLEALACTDLANCTCFKAVLATLEKR